jgi:phosphoribosylformylglycinamidine cyclo-ligase
MRYADAGVSIGRGDAALARLRGHVESTFTPHVVSRFGHFAGVCRLPGAGPGSPLLVASIDGVGTKVLVARAQRAFALVAGDLVRHGANDCLVLGARPLFFLDYVAWGRLDGEAMEDIARGLAEACRAEGAALLGGETAEMPGLYREGDFDLAGCMIGFVDEARMVDGSRVRPGDVLIALPSTGLHTNGYSLARAALLERAGLALDDALPETGTTVGQALLAPHRSYTAALLPLVERGVLSALAHITGGGLPGNLGRVLPTGTGARLTRRSWQWPGVFRAIQERGAVPDEDMVRTFNLGVGFVVFAHAEDADGVVADLSGRGERPWILGEVTAGDRGIVWAD